MAQALSDRDMRREPSVRRERFEKDAFPCLESLWRTALWLTMRCSLAEHLVLTTMTQAYCEWHVPTDRVNDRVSDKTKLFRILTREFFGCGEQRHQMDQSEQYPSENSWLTTEYRRDRKQNRISTITPIQMLMLTAISDVPVKAAIARLRPHSRLMLILLYREWFSYLDIGYITDLPMPSVKNILTRLRRLLPRYILEIAGCFSEATDSPPEVGTHVGEFARNHQRVYPNMPFIFPADSPTVSASESREE